jgi:NFU1 iron-sulfur cluster scaffold homolog, mitochondrial
MARSVQPQPTPNPNAIRFAFQGNVLGEKSRSYGNPQAARGTPWAERLFGLPGVASLFGVKDFLTITKTPAADWNAIVPRAIEILSTEELAPGGG